ncbi:MAG: hypothetical protein KGH63_01425, partial [Candidatus Micrarchaeota archaeon]|nr:hypothetical protein [Candidatus Micrarchaeota archaeon]
MSSPLGELPFSKPIPLDRFKSAFAGPVKLFMLGVAVTVALMVVVAMLPASLVPKPSWGWTWQEAPLQKNAAFALQPGQALEYEVNTSGQLARVRIAAQKAPGCPGVLLADTGTAVAIYGSLAAAQQADPGVYEVCVGPDGSERAADGAA